MADGNDRSSFNMLAAVDSTAAKFKDRVETLFQENLRKGNFINRETILNHEIGAAMRRKAQLKAPGERRQAANRVQRQQTRNGNPRGDVQGSRRGEKTLEERLSDVTI
jgi:hypothetical protein